MTLKRLHSLLLPIIVAVLVPAWMLFSSRENPGWQLLQPWDWLSLAGGSLLTAAGLGLLTWTISAFARIGGGTLAPWDPPQRLVVQGAYRYMRNPMITGVFAILLGEVLAFRSPSLFYWFLFVVVANLIYIPLLEERGLEKRFGESYQVYKRNVPRWIPRSRPWIE